MPFFLSPFVLKYFIGFVGAFFLGLYLVPVMIRAANKLRMLDHPDGKIKVHKNPVPYFGGLAVYISFISVLALVYPLDSILLWFLLGTTLLLFVGLIDDFNVLTPGQKLAGQIVAVICFLKGGFSLKSRFFANYINMAASGFWMLSVINAFNLVDVMDGLAALLALIALGSFFIIALLVQNYLLSLLLLILLGSLFSFFLYNKPGAKIYLGDAGSLFIGGFVAATPLLIRWTQELNLHSALPGFAHGSVLFETAISAMIPILLVGVPLLEVCSLVIIRKSKGLPFYAGSPHHFASYLQKKGWSPKKILWFSGLAAMFLSALALFFMFGKLSFALFLGGIILFLLVWVFVVLL